MLLKGVVKPTEPKKSVLPSVFVTAKLLVAVLLILEVKVTAFAVPPAWIVVF